MMSRNQQKSITKSCLGFCLMACLLLGGASPVQAHVPMRIHEELQLAIKNDNLARVKELETYISHDSPNLTEEEKSTLEPEDLYHFRGNVFVNACLAYNQPIMQFAIDQNFDRNIIITMLSPVAEPKEQKCFLEMLGKFSLEEQRTLMSKTLETLASGPSEISLHNYVTEKQKLSLITKLIELGADLNYQYKTSKYNCGPLIFRVTNPIFFKALLNAGADTTVKNCYGYNLLKNLDAYSDKTRSDILRKHLGLPSYAELLQVNAEKFKLKTEREKLEQQARQAVQQEARNKLYKQISWAAVGLVLAGFIFLLRRRSKSKQEKE